MAVFRGAAAALITPFHEDKSVNFDMLRTLIDRQISGGTDALVICGTTGEPATMTESERLSVIRYAVEHTAGRVPVIAGCGGNATEQTKAFALQVQRLGADALLAVTPYYNKATQGGLFEHFCAVADAVRLPVIMYIVPGRTGCNLLPETAVRIAGACPNVTGIKEACGNISQTAKLARLGEGMLDIYSGNDDQVLPMLALGASGVISVLSNVAPEPMRQMTEAYFGGDTERARELQFKLLPLAEALFCEVNPIPVKAAMHMIGYDVGGLRLPLTALESCHEKLLQDALSESGCLPE